MLPGQCSWFSQLGRPQNRTGHKTAWWKRVLFLPSVKIKVSDDWKKYKTLAQTSQCHKASKVQERNHWRLPDDRDSLSLMVQFYDCETLKLSLTWHYVPWWARPLLSPLSLVTCSCLSAWREREVGEFTYSVCHGSEMDRLFDYISWHQNEFVSLVVRVCWQLF